MTESRGRIRVRLGFTQEESTILRQFCGQLGLSPEQFCKRAVFYAVNDSYRRAAQMQAAQAERVTTVEEKKDVGATETAISTGDSSGGTQVATNVDSSALADKETGTD